MKKIILLCLLTFLSNPCLSQPSIDKIRTLHQKAAEHEEICKKLIKMLNGYENNPLLLGYKGIAVMMMAKHVFNPFKKLSYFIRGKSMLNQAIIKAKKNAELRFLRLTAQLRAPGFLDYDNYISTDKKHLVYLLSKTNNKQLKDYIIPKIKSLKIFQEKN